MGSSARTNWESDVAVDAQDIPHIVYATRGDDPGVYYTRITDIEAIIDTPVRLSVGLEQPDEVAFACVSINIDSQGRMHALWSTVSTDGFGRAVYYARSVDGGQTWSPAFRLAQREPGSGFLELPSLGFVGDSELSVIYAYPSNMGRQERISLDAGETWGEPHTIYPDLEGIAGFNVQVNDAAGNLHVLSNMRTHDQVGGLFYWRWLDGNWSPWQLANTETETTGPGGHFTAATVRLGNEIHALWNTNLSDQAGEVWHMSGIIPGVQGQTPVPLLVSETPTPQPTRADLAGQSPGASSGKNQPAKSSPSGSTEAIAALPEPSAQSLNPVFGSLAGIVPALLLVLGVVAWHLWRKN